MANPNLNNDKGFLSPSDQEFENNIRPAQIEEFAGQPQLIENLKVFIQAAKMRGEALDRGIARAVYLPVAGRIPR